MRFVLDRVLALSARDEGVLAGTLDATRVGAAGLSLGGATVYGFSFADGYRDPRVKATIVMSGLQVPYDGKTTVVGGMPVMIMHGTADPLLKYAAAQDTYAQATARPKYFVSLIGAGHAAQYEDTPDVHDAVVRRVSLDFWDAYLRGDTKAARRIVRDGTRPNLSRVESAG
jgi:predicted dienelactone hydrolase